MNDPLKTSSRNGQADVARTKEAAETFLSNVARVIVGKRKIMELVFVSLLTEGHVLLEDVPGVGKTMLAKAAAKSLDCSFRRIQCTPDLLPSDVVGISFFNQKTSEFEFRQGPIASNIVLVDEINRAMPRTQSCLLECMQEQQVTVDLETVQLPRPFMLLATQNPIELEGTFPLPEAQLDRFLIKIKLGYPSPEEEASVLSRFQEASPLDDLPCVLGSRDLMDLQHACRKVHVEKSVREYIVAVTRATREHPEVKLGASPRAALGLQSASQAFAAMQGRGYVIPDDVKYLAGPVLSHRMIAKTESVLKGRFAEQIVEEILSTVPVPVEGDEGRPLR
ncbi:MAG: MoxR family ATPase [Desulfobacteraceae bacterium]|nr:MAG: MoxR family ATPase [Desulfobacteraceae bacterium]